MERQIESREKKVPEEEVKIVEEIVKKFIFNTDKKQINQVDLNLALKALPSRVDEKNCYRVNLFSFETRQTSIISFKNSEQDQLFKFYDTRNKARLRKLQTRSKETLYKSEKVDQDMNSVAVTVRRLRKNADDNAGMNRKRNFNVILSDPAIKRMTL